VCWEAATWKNRDKKASYQALETLPIKLDRFWRDEVFPQEFSFPRIFMLTQRAGWSALMSPGGFLGSTSAISADSSRIYDDMERLIRASWISTRNVLRDTTTTRFNNQSLSNLAEGPDGKVSKGVAQFVLQSPDVGTLSVRVLISVPSVLLFMLFLQAILSCYLSHASIKGKHPLRHLVSRATALEATQIYRSLDEKTYGEGRWKGRQEAIPYVDRSEAPVSGTAGEGKRACTYRTPWAAVSENTLVDDQAEGGGVEGRDGVRFEVAPEVRPLQGDGNGLGGIRSQSGGNFPPVRDRAGYEQLPTGEN
jgi:hypothetical protein